MCMCVYVENIVMASSIKMICSPVCVCVCVYMLGKSIESMWWFMTFGDNVSGSSSWQKNVACFFALCPVCDAFCCLSSLPLSVC